MAIKPGTKVTTDTWRISFTEGHGFNTQSDTYPDKATALKELEEAVAWWASTDSPIDDPTVATRTHELWPEGSKEITITGRNGSVVEFFIGPKERKS